MPAGSFLKSTFYDGIHLTLQWSWYWFTSIGTDPAGKLYKLSILDVLYVLILTFTAFCQTREISNYWVYKIIN